MCDILCLLESPGSKCSYFVVQAGLEPIMVAIENPVKTREVCLTQEQGEADL